MKKRNTSTKSGTAATTKTPEAPDDEDREEHPLLEDDPGAWSDQDRGWILQDQMP